MNAWPSTWRIGAAGVVLAASLIGIAAIEPRTHIGVYLALALGATGAYLVALRTIAGGDPGGSRALWVALAGSALWRVPLLLAPPLLSIDIYRYIWDGRIQRLGHNPYVSAPADPALQALHSPLTRLTDHGTLPTIYPPLAELFFRAVASVHESIVAFKLAIVFADLFIVLVLLAWLSSRNRSRWWVLAYAWHPLVALEGAGSGHLDLLGVFLLVAAIVVLERGRRMTGTMLLAGSAAVKFLPIVLVPLLWRRVRWRDAGAGVVVLALLYAWFLPGANGVPTGSLSAYAMNWRFNGPVFRLVQAIMGTTLALAVPVAVGLAAAAVARARTTTVTPAAWAWAWPLALTVLFMPAIYPWYLLWLTPFAASPGTAPLTAWTLTVLLAHVVWQSELAGLGWTLPAWVPWLEFGAPLLVAFWMTRRDSAPGRSPRHET